MRISVTSADGKELIVALIRSNDCFGELALLDSLPRSADAVASEPCVLLILPREALLALLRERPEASAAMLATLSRVLRRTTDQLQEAAFLDVPSRLLRSIAGLAPAGDADDDAFVRLTQAKLGALVGASRESVNKWLSNFERRGLIRRYKGGLEILIDQASSGWLGKQFSSQPSTLVAESSTALTCRRVPRMIHASPLHCQRERDA